ncbi:MAG: GGDEF domain-containing protein [Lachnospiraceae bacterium]|nr:GGDEF domain-containing protein [Lachnospiraceae bacterium]
MKKGSHLIQMIYVIMVSCFSILLLWAVIYYKGPQMRDDLAQGNIPVEEGWFLTGGDEADISHLQQIEGIAPYQETSVYYKLPQQLTDIAFLCFRSKNINYQVYVGGKLRYEPYHEDNIVYMKSQGTRWNFIPLFPDDAEKMVEIRFMIVYENATACIDHVVIGMAAGQILDIVAEKALAAITAGLIMLMGIILMVLDIPVNIQKEKNHELLYLGVFAFMIGAWCFTETNILQVFFGDSRMIQLLSCGLIPLFTIPLMLYLNASFEQKPEKLIRGICFLSALQFIACTVLHFLGIMDYHETLILAHIILILAAVMLFYAGIRNSFKFLGEQENRVYQIARGIGLISIAVTAAIDVFRYYLKTGGDNAMFIRFGLLIWILCFGGSSMKRTVEAVRKGAHVDFVSQLAYMDGLTGIGNRTAFQEKMEELEKGKQEKGSIGIVIFDVNNLKWVNDTLGHSEGDQMIKKGAETIRQAFAQEKGDCYRIGGDEFAVFLTGDQIAERCEQAIGRLLEELHIYNSRQNREYELSIASGYAVYDESCAEMTLTELFETADARMYENKKKMKNKS